MSRVSKADQGVQGNQGNQGNQGASGTATVTEYNDNSGTIANGTSHTLGMACPTGTTATGGGTNIVDSNGDAQPGGYVTETEPIGNGWVGVVVNVTGGNMTQTTYVMCATP